MAKTPWKYGKTEYDHRYELQAKYTNPECGFGHVLENEINESVNKSVKNAGDKGCRDI